jgi:DNA phosphorothioation-dependent restriction protein DptG
LIDWELGLGDVTVRSAVIDLTILLIRIFDFGYICQVKLDFEDFRNLKDGCNGYLKVMG